jgi:glutaminase
VWIKVDELLKFNFRKPFTYALCLNEIGADIVQKFIGREPSGRIFNEIALDYNGNEEVVH